MDRWMMDEEIKGQVDRWMDDDTDLNRQADLYL